MPAVKIFTLLFPGGKHKALTLSYDDGVRQDIRLVETLNQYGIKATFNLGAGLLSTPGTLAMGGKTVDITRLAAGEVSNLYRGHEIAGHGYTHMALPSADTGAAMYEIIMEKSALEKITGSFVRGFAYPFGTFDENVKLVLKLAGVEYARTIKSVKDFRLPDDFLEWNPTCHHNDADLMKLAEQFCSTQQMFFQPKLFYLWGHSYEFDQHDNWNVMEEFLAFMAQHLDEVWSATNLEIADYVKAYRQLRFSADGNMVHNPTNIELWFDMRFEPYHIKPGETVTIRERETIL